MAVKIVETVVYRDPEDVRRGRRFQLVTSTSPVARAALGRFDAGAAARAAFSLNFLFLLPLGR